eukprot:Phypoly_transcript_13315.p1 GENE.Phypoly_transcript_13315~~Phypoly_transcript_13315.p1  ORF type:complete len:296 (+),score=56.53 Phypoly_transcript_13315:175-1062(+)
MALRVALLSPGDMGHSIAMMLLKNKVDVITCLSGRSQRTKQLAEKAGIRVVDNDVTLVKEASIILSVLVPSKAGEIVDRIIHACKDVTPKPLFADLNAIAPDTVKEFSTRLSAHGIDLVDGGIVGGPPRNDYNPRIYVSGKRAKELEILSSHGLDIRVLGDEIGQASGFKMSYAALSKGLIALGVQAFTAAKEMGVEEQFKKEMLESQPDVYNKVSKSIPSMCPKAYRWVGEMEEIAKTYQALGMTGKIYEGAADLFQMITDSPLGKEIVEDRKLGKTMESAIDTLIEHIDHKKK